jgi:hypothetical protein
MFTFESKTTISSGHFCPSLETLSSTWSEAFLHIAFSTSPRLSPSIKLALYALFDPSGDYLLSGVPRAECDFCHHQGQDRVHVTNDGGLLWRLSISNSVYLSTRVHSRKNLFLFIFKQRRVWARPMVSLLIIYQQRVARCYEPIVAIQGQGRSTNRLKTPCRRQQ